MRTARLVGLSQDGRSLIVATDTGEELAILADDRLRAALRGDRPRLGQLEIEMESALRPRDIQSRIRAGASLDEVATMAGIPMDRVERYAAPVLAEREHVASLARAASVRRRGETSAHKKLQVALAERLSGRGVDIDSLEWDSARMDDGRWAVSATFQTGKSVRKAIFHFDVQGRFSVAGNEDARWVLGEQPPRATATRKRSAVEAADTEPTVDLSDELALVRAIQEKPAPAVAQPEPEPESDPQVPVQLALVGLPDDHTGDKDDDRVQAAVQHAREEPAASEEEHALHPGDSELDVLYDMLGGDGYSEDSVRVYSGLSDASAVPETDQLGWEPEIVVNYPIEPDPLIEPSLLDEVAEEVEPPLKVPTEAELEGEQTSEAVPEPPEPVPAARKPAKKKRAAVPSWDEIMFGGPKRP